MQRSVELEVDEHGGVAWYEGRIELAPNVAAAIAALPPRSLVLLHGDYARPDRHTKILHVNQLPTTVTMPIDRALHAWYEAKRLTRDPAAFERFERYRGVVEHDRSALGRALHAALAAREGRRDEAAEHFREALRLGATKHAASALESVWRAVGPIELTPDLADALLLIVWSDIHAWHEWIDPVAFNAHQRVVPRDQCPRPWHFGGPRITANHEIVAAWLLRYAEQIATPIEGVGIAELRAMSVREQRAWLKASERRDKHVEDDAYRAVVRAHPADSEDSPPDSADPGLLENDQPLLAWLHYVLREPDYYRVESLARDLVSATHHFVAAPAARELALVIDAVVLASALAPQLAANIRSVAYARIALRNGFVIVRAGDSFGLMCAPQGAFGAWTHLEGDRDAILAAIPDALRGEVRTALHGAAAVIAVEPGTRRLFERREDVPKRKPPAPEPPPPVERFVTHVKFGRGRVIEARTESGETKLLVEFDGIGRKLLLERFVTAAD